MTLVNILSSSQDKVCLSNISSTRWPTFSIQICVHILRQIIFGSFHEAHGAIATAKTANQAVKIFFEVSQNFGIWKITWFGNCPLSLSFYIFLLQLPFIIISLIHLFWSLTFFHLSLSLIVSHSSICFFSCISFNLCFNLSLSSNSVNIFLIYLSLSAATFVSSISLFVSLPMYLYHLTQFVSF